MAISLRELGAARVEVVAVDLSSAQAVDRLSEEVLRLVEELPPQEPPPPNSDTPAPPRGLYLLVNNAGAISMSGLGALSGDPDEWDRLMALNLHAPMRLTRRLSQALCAAAATGPHEGAAPGQGAAIVNIGSVAGVEAMSGMGMYCASKAGLRSWSMCCYRELRPHNIKVTVIQPGYVHTPLVPAGAGDPARMIQVSDIAACVLLVVDSSLACCPEEITLRPVLPVVPLSK